MKKFEELFNAPQGQNEAPDVMQRKTWRRVHGLDQEIVIQESTLSGDASGLIHYDCGCSRPAQLLWKFVGEPFNTWMGATVCKNHFRVCEGCGRGLCIAGNADGFRLDYDSETYWLCTPCLQSWQKQIRKRNFWAGFKRGLFGGG